MLEKVLPRVVQSRAQPLFLFSDGGKVNCPFSFYSLNNDVILVVYNVFNEYNYLAMCLNDKCVHSGTQMKLTASVYTITPKQWATLSIASLSSSQNQRLASVHALFMKLLETCEVLLESIS